MPKFEKEPRPLEAEFVNYKWENESQDSNVATAEVEEFSDLSAADKELLEKEMKKIEESLENENSPENKDDQKISLAKTKEKIRNMIPYVLEGGHQAIKALDKGLDATKKVVDAAIPASVSLISGFFLPAHVDRILAKGTALGTKAATTVSKGMVKGALNLFTLGGPAWLEAFRKHRAVQAGKSLLKDAGGTKDILASSYLEHLKNPDIKKSLGKYYDLRRKLKEIRETDPANTQEIEKLSIALASYEVNYKDNVDFNNLKSVLEKGSEFAKHNEAFVEQLSQETAAEMIRLVEDFYRDNVAAKSDTVKGKWLGIITSPEKGKAKLQETIAAQLQQLMSQEMTDKEVQSKIKKINKDVVSAFGVQRGYLKALTFTALRLIPIPGMAEGDAETSQSYLGSIVSKFKEGWDAKWTGEPKPEILSEVFDFSKIDPQKLNFFPTPNEYLGLATGAVEKTSQQCSEIIGYNTADQAKFVYDWAAEKTKDIVMESLGETGENVLETGDKAAATGKGLFKALKALKKVAVAAVK